MTYSEDSYKTPYFKRGLVCIIGCLFFSLIQGQTSLGAGDIAITGYNQHSHNVNGNGTYKNGQFSFVLLVDIASGTEIKFTDRGWRGSAFVSGSNNNEGVLTWTSTGAMSGGSQIVITIDHSSPYGLPTATQGNVTNTHNFKLKEKKRGSDFGISGK
jgi:uncharacterized protein (UPF0333 family)